MARGRHPRPNVWLDLWLTAAAEPLGLFIRSPNIPLFRATMGAARRNAKPEVRSAIAHLSIRTDPSDPQGSVWIVHGSNEENEE